jgi:PST family polysaccharide transporter
LKTSIIKYKELIENFASLYILQITNILIPLVTLPYLVRVLGVESFGLVSFAQVFAMFFVMVVDFGFNLSIVRLISVNSENKEKVSEIFSSVIVIKLILLLLSFLLYYGIVNSVERFAKDELLYLYMYGIVIGQGLFPVWFFQGVQKMRYITILNFIVKIVFLALIFLLIHSNSDYLNYPILLSFGYISILPFAFYIIKKEFHVVFYIPPIERLVYYTKYSSHFFVSRIALRLYEGGGLFVVGLIAPDVVVGYYAIADKLRGAITSLYSPISQALYPYIAKERNVKLYKKLFSIINVLNILGLMVLFVYTQEILEFVFGGSSETTILFMRIFIFVMVLDVPSILLGYPLLGAFGYTNYVNYSLVVTAVIYLVSLFVLYLIGVLSAKIIAILYIFTIFIEFSLRAFGVYKYKLWSENV